MGLLVCSEGEFDFFLRPGRYHRLDILSVAKFWLSLPLLWLLSW